MAGWEPSDNDNDSNRRWVEEMQTQNHDPKIGLIIAIGKKKRAAGQAQTQPGLQNVRFLQIDRSLIALAAYRIIRDARYTAERVTLKAPAVLGD